MSGVYGQEELFGTTREWVPQDVMADTMGNTEVY